MTIEQAVGSASVLKSMREPARKAAELLRAIGNPYRLMVLCFLIEGEKTVTEICDALSASQSLISQHLSRLRRDGIVSTKRNGHYVYYSLNDTLTKEIVATLYKHYCSKEKRETKTKG